MKTSNKHLTRIQVAREGLNERGKLKNCSIGVSTFLIVISRASPATSGFSTWFGLKQHLSKLASSRNWKDQPSRPMVPIHSFIIFRSFKINFSYVYYLYNDFSVVFWSQLATRKILVVYFIQTPVITALQSSFSKNDVRCVFVSTFVSQVHRFALERSSDTCRLYQGYDIHQAMRAIAFAASPLPFSGCYMFSSGHPVKTTSGDPLSQRSRRIYLY